MSQLISQPAEAIIARRIITDVFADSIVTFNEGDGLEAIDVDSKFTLHRSDLDPDGCWELCIWNRPSPNFVVLGRFVDFIQAVRRLVVVMARRRTEDSLLRISTEIKEELTK